MSIKQYRNIYSTHTLSLSINLHLCYNARYNDSNNGTSSLAPFPSTHIIVIQKSSLASMPVCHQCTPCTVPHSKSFHTFVTHLSSFLSFKFFENTYFLSRVWLVFWVISPRNTRFSDCLPFRNLLEFPK